MKPRCSSYNKYVLMIMHIDVAQTVFKKEFAARKRSNSRAYINNLAFNNVVVFSMGHMESWVGAVSVNSVVGALFPDRTLSTQERKGSRGHGTWGSVRCGEVWVLL